MAEQIEVDSIRNSCSPYLTYKNCKMIKKIALTVLLLFVAASLKAQIDGTLLLGLTLATTAEMSTITGPVEGSLIYNSEEEKMYLNTASGFVGIPSADDASNSYYVGSFIISGTGNQSITGLPFEPSSVTFTAYANIDSANIDADNGVNDNENTAINVHGSMMGFARNDGGSIAQQVIFNGASGASVNDISRYASSSHSIGLRYADNNGTSLGLTSASLTSFNTDGFTVNTDNFTGGILVIFEAHK